MKKCNCGFRTWNKRRYLKHVKECDGIAKAIEGNTEGQEIERKQAKEIKAEKVIDTTPELLPFEEVEEEFEDEEIEEEFDYESMTIHELRKLAREADIDGIYSKNKAELIEALKEGE